MQEEFRLKIDTTADAAELDGQLREFEPWSALVEFSNGLSTENYRQRTPFNKNPLRKMLRSSQVLPLAEMGGKRLLDIGCNIGYNCIHASTNYGMKTTGIDVVTRHIEKSRFLAEMAGADCEFLEESAEEFCRPGEFDVVLHYGTLYHLPNPIRSLQLAFDNLNQGGYMILETQHYDHLDVGDNLVYFMRGLNNDNTNWWALSTPVLHRILEAIGFKGIQEIFRSEHRHSVEGMYRVQTLARKAF